MSNFIKYMPIMIEILVQSFSEGLMISCLKYAVHNEHKNL